MKTLSFTLISVILLIATTLSYFIFLYPKSSSKYEKIEFIAIKAADKKVQASTSPAQLIAQVIEKSNATHNPKEESKTQAQAKAQTESKSKSDPLPKTLASAEAIKHDPLPSPASSPSTPRILTYTLTMEEGTNLYRLVKNTGKLQALDIVKMSQLPQAEKIFTDLTIGERINIFYEPNGHITKLMVREWVFTAHADSYILERRKP